MKTYLTKADYESIKSDLAEKERRIEDLTQKLGEAAKKSGSFVTSNPEYMGIKSQIDTLQTLADSIKNLLGRVEVLEISSLPSQVTNYSLVEAICPTSGENFKYYIQIPLLTLYRRGEATNASPESPLGKALYGKNVGDKVEVELPTGKLELKILNIQKI